MDSKSKNVFLDSILYVVVGVAIGSVMALAAGSFLYVAEFLSAFSDTSEKLISGQWSRFVPLVFLVLAACLILVLRRMLGLKRFHSPSETIAAVHSERPIDIKAGLGSTLAALISVGGGASVGQYGPPDAFWRYRRCCRGENAQNQNSR